MLLSCWFRYFDLCGFFTEYKQSKHQIYNNRIILAVFICIGIISRCLTLEYFKRYERDALGGINDVVKLEGFQIFFWTTLIESYFKRRKLRNCWIILRLIHKNYQNKNNNLNRFRWIFIFSCATFIVTHSRLTYSVFEFNVKYRYFWFSYMFNMVIILSRLFYHTIFMEIIRNELKTIHQEIQKLVTNVMWTKCTMDRLKSIREYHAMVYHFSETINCVHGWSNAITILFSFTLLLCDINWVYWKWYNQTELHILPGKCIIFCIYVIPELLLFFSVLKNLFFVLLIL